MRETNTSGTMRGVGYNPLLAWGRFKLAEGEQPVIEHGLGLSATLDEEGKIVVKVDPGIKPRYWTPVISSVGETTFTIERLDEPGGTFTVLATWPEPEPPAEEPAAEEPPVEDPPVEDPPVEEPPVEEPPVEPTEPPAEPPAEEPAAEEPPAEEPAEEPAAEPPAGVLLLAAGVAYLTVIVVGVSV